MSLNINSMMTQALATVFALGSDLIKAGEYVRPAGLSASTGLTSPTEVRADCDLLSAFYSVQRPTSDTPQVIFERVFIQASDLTTISSPAPNDIIEENISGIRREILTAVQDVTGLLWIFETKRVAGWEDWGDLTAHSLAEDWGDLTAATTFDEYGAIA